MSQLKKNGYKAFWKGQSRDVEAMTSYSAQQIAAEKWKIGKRRYHEVAVMLAELAGVPVVHSPAILAGA